MTTLIRNVNQAAADKLRVWLNEARSGSCILSREVTIEAVEHGGLMIRLKQFQDYDALKRELRETRSQLSIAAERVSTLEAELHRRRFIP